MEFRVTFTPPPVSVVVIADSMESAFRQAVSMGSPKALPAISVEPVAPVIGYRPDGSPIYLGAAEGEPLAPVSPADREAGVRPGSPMARFPRAAAR
jgi:hypothetical protein